MIISINGQPQDVPEGVSVQVLLERLGYHDAFVAVALNSSCISRKYFQETFVGEHDKIEILAPMAGG